MVLDTNGREIQGIGTHLNKPECYERILVTNIPFT